MLNELWIHALILNGPEKGSIVQVRLHRMLTPNGYTYHCKNPGKRGMLTYEFQDFNIEGKKFWVGSAMQAISMARALTIALSSGIEKDDLEEASTVYEPITE